MGAAFTLTVTGTNFLAASVVKFGGTARTTTFVSATQLTADIPADAIAKWGYASVTVTSTAPGGGISNSVQFFVGLGGCAGLSCLSASSGAVDFGNQTIHSTSAARTVTLTNTGNAPEPVDASMNGTFTPSANGRRFGILVIEGNPDEVDVGLSGTGIPG